MINVSYDAHSNTVIMEIKGDVDAVQAEYAREEVGRVIPKGKGGFKFLADFSAVDVIEPEVKAEMAKTMDLLNEFGVTDVIRVLPDPAWDLGFDRLSDRHYAPQVHLHTLHSRSEANARLGQGRFY